MSYFGSVFDTGPANGMPAIGVPLNNPDPGQDYISSGPGRLTPRIPQLLAGDFDDVVRNFGLRTYEAMLTDPAVSSNYLALKLSILNGPIQVMPAVKPKGYKYKPPGQRRPAGGSAAPGVREEPGTVQKPSPDEQLSQEIAEFCERELARLEAPIKSTLLQMLDAMAFGVKLAEKTRELAEDGPDKGKLVLRSLKVKPSWSWKFVVNCFMKTVGILTYVPPGSIGGPIPDDNPAESLGGLVILPPEKFAIFAWLPKDNDPRGTSILRAAYDWWNLKQQVKPFYYAHLRRFGSPSLDGELAEKDTSPSAAINTKTGAEIPGSATVSAAQRFYSQLVAFQNNSVIVRPFGSKLNVLEPTSNGEAFLNAFDLFDRQICLAIGLQARAAMEAKHGSKADSDTAENTRGLVIAYGRESLGDWAARQIFYDSVKLNWGKDVADRLTPRLEIGQTEAQDRPAEWTAAASLGYSLGQSQLEEMDALLGLPDRDMAADQAAAQAAMEAMAAGPDNDSPAQGVPKDIGGGDPDAKPPGGGAKGATKPARPADSSGKGVK